MAQELCGASEERGTNGQPRGTAWDFKLGLLRVVRWGETFRKIMEDTKQTQFKSGESGMILKALRFFQVFLRHVLFR